MGQGIFADQAKMGQAPCCQAGYHIAGKSAAAAAGTVADDSRICFYFDAGPMADLHRLDGGYFGLHSGGVR
jgi:hypothetical protein